MGRGLPWHGAACACAVWLGLAGCGVPPLTGIDGGDASTDAHSPEMGGADGGDAGSTDLGGTDAGDDAGDVDGGTCVPASCPWECVAGTCDTPVQVSVGASHACLVTVLGRLWCWGANANGESGTEPSTPLLRPTRSPLIGDAREVRVGANFTCIRRDSTGVQCSGYDTNGTLGNGMPLMELHSFGDTLPPITAGTLSTTYLTVCATLDPGSSVGPVRCWGDDTNGAVGDGLAVPGRAVPAPTEVLLDPAASGMAITNAVQVACEADACCALIDTGNVVCWGLNDQRQLGDGTTMVRTGAVSVIGASGVTRLIPSSDKMYALVGDSVVTWGAGVSYTALTTTGIADVAAGRDHYCLVSMTGTVSCIGDNTYGQVGVGTTGPVVALTDVGLAGVVSISSSWNTTCAITDTGALSCWGRNNMGQAGTGDDLFGDVLTPTPVTP